MVREEEDGGDKRRAMMRNIMGSRMMREAKWAGRENWRMRRKRRRTTNNAQYVQGRWRRDGWCPPFCPILETQVSCNHMYVWGWGYRQN